MKKYVKLIICLGMALMLCFIMASCSEKEVQPCETHTDADGNLVCDVCQAAITPAGPSKKEIIAKTKASIVTAMNNFLSSGKSLVDGERKLPDFTTSKISVDTNLSSKHWISRLKTVEIQDGNKIKLTLENNNKAATKSTEDVYIVISQNAIFAISDDTTRLDYVTHAYTSKEIKVNTNEITSDMITYNESSDTYSFSNDCIKSLFEKILLSENINSLLNRDELYTKKSIQRIVENLKSTSEVAVNSNGKITKLNAKLYTEDNGLKTDICTIEYNYSSKSQSFSMSLNLNYMVNINYKNEMTNTFKVYTTSFSYETSKPDDKTFKSTKIALNSKTSRTTENLSIWPKDIQSKIEQTVNTYEYLPTIKEKYNQVYSIVNNEMLCQNIYVYDERYDVYILFGKNETSGVKQVVFKSIEFDVELSDACFGIMNLGKKQITVQEHSDAEILREELKAIYNHTFTSTKTECLNMAVRDESGKYILFKRKSVDGSYVYVYNGISDTFDSSTTCLAEVNLTKLTIKATEHNTNHTSH